MNRLLDWRETESDSEICRAAAFPDDPDEVRNAVAVGVVAESQLGELLLVNNVLSIFRALLVAIFPSNRIYQHHFIFSNNVNPHFAKAMYFYCVTSLNF